VAILLIIGGMTLLILGSWRLSDGLNGIVIDYSNPYVHFSETTAAQEVVDGIIYSVLGVMLCSFHRSVREKAKFFVSSLKKKNLKHKSARGKKYSRL
jgi:Ca2+/Na+ antiporter